MKKILFAAVAAALLAAGCSSQTASNTSVNTPASPTPTEQSMNAGATDNASLNSDLGNIDSQMNALNTDSGNVDSSINQQTAP